MTAGTVLVPVEESSTLRNTVAYVLRRAVESTEPTEGSKGAEPTERSESAEATEGPEGAEPTDPSERAEPAGPSEPHEPTEPAAAVHFVYPLSSRGLVGDENEEANELLERIELWAEEDLGDDADRVAIETAVVGQDEYLFSPGDYADVLAEYADEHAIESVVLDPEYNPSGATPLLPALESEIRGTGLSVEEAPVDRPTRRNRLVRRSGAGQFLLLFGLSTAFYLLLSWSLAPYDLVTGAVTGAVVATVLWHVSLTGPVRVRRLLGQTGRLCLYVPFLLWEIAKANVGIAYVVLHPSLPIDPEVVEFDAAVWSEVPVATLANSITLTPGTLTIDVESRHFTIHTLTAGAREDLFDGVLERAVRFVFYGRTAARMPTSSEREGR